MEAATKNKKGRPKVFNSTDLWLSDSGEDLLHRGRVNRAYRDIGIDRLLTACFPDCDFDDNEMMWFITDSFGVSYRKKAGVLEQLGRMEKSNLFTENELNQIVEEILKAIRQGRKSKEIENELRQYRISRKKGGKE